MPTAFVLTFLILLQCCTNVEAAPPIPPNEAAATVQAADDDHNPFGKAEEDYSHGWEEQLIKQFRSSLSFTSLSTRNQDPASSNATSRGSSGTLSYEDYIDVVVEGWEKAQGEILRSLSKTQRNLSGISESVNPKLNESSTRKRKHDSPNPSSYTSSNDLKKFREQSSAANDNSGNLNDSGTKKRKHGSPDVSTSSPSNENVKKLRHGFQSMT